MTKTKMKTNKTFRSVFIASVLLAGLWLCQTHQAVFAQGETPPAVPQVAQPTERPSNENSTQDRRVIQDDQNVVGGSFVLASDETIQGDLNVLGGSATLKKGSIVEGDVSVAGGSVEIYGTVRGDVNVAGGSITLKSGSLVEGTTASLGGSINKEEGATTRHGVSQVDGVGVIPDIAKHIPAIDNPRVRVNTDFGDPFGTLGGIVLITLFALVAQHFMRANINLMSEVLRTQALFSTGVGLLTLIAVPIALTITIVGIIALPVAAVGLFVGALIGWTAIASLIGAWLMRGLGKTNWTAAGQTAAGAIALALLGSLPVLGGAISAIAAFAGLGVLVLTRIGTQRYPRLGLSVYSS